MDMHQPTLTRRTMLRGLGVSMALPWLESKSVMGSPASPNAENEAPVRMAILFAGCGFHRHEWWAKGQGASMELGKVLEPLLPYRDRLTFVRGLYNEQAL